MRNQTLPPTQKPKGALFDGGDDESEEEDLFGKKKTEPEKPKEAPKEEPKQEVKPPEPVSSPPKPAAPERPSMQD